jgi:hypothetical protein
LEFLDGRDGWDESPEGEWVFQWSFAGRPHPRTFPLNDLTARVSGDNRGQVILTVLTIGVTHGCTAHASLRHAFVFPDTGLPHALTEFERAAHAVDLADLAVCTLFGPCAERIIANEQQIASSSGVS